VTPGYPGLDPFQRFTRESDSNRPSLHRSASGLLPPPPREETIGSDRVWGSWIFRVRPSVELDPEGTLLAESSPLPARSRTRRVATVHSERISPAGCLPSTRDGRREQRHAALPTSLRYEAASGSVGRDPSDSGGGTKRCCGSLAFAAVLRGLRRWRSPSSLPSRTIVPAASIRVGDEHLTL
jgi:hypothetical protein